MLFRILQRKARADLEAYLATLNVDDDHRKMIVSLAELNGGKDVLEEARVLLKKAGVRVQDALSHLERLDYSVHSKLNKVSLHFDLAELRGYRYQSGVVFAVFAPGHGQEIARGGRYDDIGRLFGRPRPATGFSADLKTLMMLGDKGETGRKKAIAAPWSDCEALQRYIHSLRVSGERVINELPDQQGSPADLGCDRKVVKQDGEWTVVPIGDGSG